MSDARVSAALDDLERLLAALVDAPVPGVVQAWHTAFKEALATAERGSQWPAIAARAKDLNQRLDLAMRNLQAIKGAIRLELQAKEKGHRALMGYRPSGYRA